MLDKRLVFGKMVNWVVPGYLEHLEHPENLMVLVILGKKNNIF